MPAVMNTLARHAVRSGYWRRINSFHVLSLEERTKEPKVFKGNFCPVKHGTKPLTFFRFMRLLPSADAIPAKNPAIAAEDFQISYSKHHPMFHTTLNMVNSQWTIFKAAMLAVKDVSRFQCSAFLSTFLTCVKILFDSAFSCENTPGGIRLIFSTSLSLRFRALSTSP